MMMTITMRMSTTGLKTTNPVRVPLCTIYTYIIRQHHRHRDSHHNHQHHHQHNHHRHHHHHHYQHVCSVLLIIPSMSATRLMDRNYCGPVPLVRMMCPLSALGFRRRCRRGSRRSPGLKAALRDLGCSPAVITQALGHHNCNQL